MKRIGKEVMRNRNHKTNLYHLGSYTGYHNNNRYLYRAFTLKIPRAPKQWTLGVNRLR